MNNFFQTCEFSKENNPGKSYVQSLLYRQSNVKGPATIVSGPAIKRHLEDASKYIQINNSSIDIVEINIDILIQIMKNYSELNNYSNVKFILSDIGKIDNLGRFVDADLTASLVNSFNTFKALFDKMIKRKSKFSQNLICTYSLRNTNKVSLSKFLIDLGIADTTADVKLRSKLNLPSLGNFTKEYYSVKTYQDIIKDQRFEIYTVTYNTGTGPMCSVSIQW